MSAGNRWLSAVTLAALAVATGLAVLLALENRELKQDLAYVQEQTALPHEGLLLPAHDAYTLDGHSVTLSGAGEAQVLLFLTTTCPFCRATLPAWHEIARDARALGIAVYGVQLDSARLAGAYVEEHAIGFPIVTFADPQDAARLGELYRIQRVPLTIVVDAHGRVALARVGEIRAAGTLDSIRAALTRVASGEEARARPQRDVL